MYYESSVNSVTSAVWAVNSEVLPPYLMVFFLQKLSKKNRCAYKNSQKTQLTHRTPRKKKRSGARVRPGGTRGHRIAWLCATSGATGSPVSAAP